MRSGVGAVCLGGEDLRVRALFDFDFEVFEDFLPAGVLFDDPGLGLGGAPAPLKSVNPVQDAMSTKSSRGAFTTDQSIRPSGRRRPGMLNRWRR